MSKVYLGILHSPSLKSIAISINLT